jgi:hypothetical protein
MKFLHVTVHFEFAEAVQAMLDRADAANFARYSMVEGKDSDGKHMGTQAFPGNITVFHAHIEDDRVDGLFDELRTFRDEKRAHNHLRALILPIERQL